LTRHVEPAQPEVPWPPPRVGARPAGWSFAWRWAVWSVAGYYGAGLAVGLLTAILRGPEAFRAGGLAVAVAELAIAVVVGALQARLLQGHVRAPRRWLAIAVVAGLVFATVVFVIPEGPRPFQHVLRSYLVIGSAAVLVAIAQWLFVLDEDIAGSVRWVPIVLVAWLTGAVVRDVTLTVGVPAGTVLAVVLEYLILGLGMARLIRQAPSRIEAPSWPSAADR
jgi:hypothetical protein